MNNEVHRHDDQDIPQQRRLRTHGFIFQAQWFDFPVFGYPGPTQQTDRFATTQGAHQGSIAGSFDRYFRRQNVGTRQGNCGKLGTGGRCGVSQGEWYVREAYARGLHVYHAVIAIQNQAVEKMFWLEPGPIQAPTRNIVYLTRPIRSHLQTIAEQIKNHQRSDTPVASHTYHVILAPRITSLATNIIEELGIGGDVEVKELGLGSSWIVLEDDLISLEKESGVIRDLWLASLFNRIGSDR
jgi:hypothetical protein